MPVIPQLFAITHATILKPIESTSSMSTVKAIANSNSYIIQLSLFTCLFIISLFLILITLFLFFVIFVYIRYTQQSFKQELVWARRRQKWLGQLAIKRRRHYRKKRDRHHHHQHFHYINQSFSILQEQDYFNSIKSQFLSSLQTHDQVVQYIDEFVYQL